MFQKDNVQYIPWKAGKNDLLQLHYKSLNITPRVVFNKTVLKALDNTFNRIETNLHLKFKNLYQEIDKIKETQETSTALIIGSVALGLSGINTIILIVISCFYNKARKQQQERTNSLIVQYQKEIPKSCIECQEPLETIVEQEEETQEQVV